MLGAMREVFRGAIVTGVLVVEPEQKSIKNPCFDSLKSTALKGVCYLAVSF